MDAMLRSAALFLEILRIHWHFLRVEFHFQNNHPRKINGAISRLALKSRCEVIKGLC